jgi:hypothetical protein
MLIGHVYRYATRNNELESIFVLLKLDDIKGHKVASIAIHGVSMQSKTSPDGIAKFIGHFPISLDSLMASNPVDTGSKQDAVWPNDGYEEWISAVKEGKAGFWSKPLKECIDILESVLSK